MLALFALTALGWLTIRSRFYLTMAHYGFLASERDNCVSLSRSNPELLAEDSCTESSVDHLNTSRGVVLSRAATILRSIETQPSTGGFVRSFGTTMKPLSKEVCVYDGVVI